MEICEYECKKSIYLEKLFDRNFDTSQYPALSVEKKMTTPVHTHPSDTSDRINRSKSPLKTGDLILFKSTDNINSFRFGNYFTHIGMVVVDKILTNNIPCIFESCPSKNMNIPHNRPDTWNAKFSRGILLIPLKERLKKYRGYIYYKPLLKPITDIMNISLINFIFYALNNMEYNYNIISSSLKKITMGEKCNNKTNCGELIFLALIQMGLLNNRLWDQKVVHYLKWMCDITKLNNFYNYKPIIEITKVLI